MSHGFRHSLQARRAARNLRARALERPELRLPASGIATVPAAGATSAAVRELDGDTRAMIDAALADRRST